MTAGSRGDVAPYTGLAHGLAQAGHELTVVTHAPFESLVARAGVGFVPLPVDPRAELESSRGHALHRSATGAGKLVRLVRMARELVGDMVPPLVRTARDSDLLLVSSSLAPLGYAIGGGMAVPSMGVYLQPLAPTREFCPSVVGTRSCGPLGNRLAGHAVNGVIDRIYADAVRHVVSAELGLPRRAARHFGSRARERARWPVQHGFSPLVVRRPADWRPGLAVSGYWWPYDPPDARLPRRVRDFLEAGAPPVFVGLGSATVPDAGRLSAELVRALRAAGLRGVIQRGWAGLHADGDDMLTVDEVPHALLFPRMAAVVHHAGAGTTAAGLRAGVPSVPVPVQFDAGFWAARLTALGVAPAAVPLRGLRADRLAAALVAAVRRQSYARRAADVAARLGKEDGVAPVLAEAERLGS
ncbi:glycosyltransferase family 1 protein [Streptomyces sp. SB3404]|uniref:Glycosyltransferase family 1 protein n=2 Tax=Streptomyces boncukensis TaxID=2711219 RepID=A0A6G4X6K2_9ACTN|nr:glycosyltransferase family 1 protein [Streptomyces boncukensis]